MTTPDATQIRAAIVRRDKLIQKRNTATAHRDYLAASDFDGQIDAEANTISRCPHNWNYVTRYHDKDVYRCNICGATEAER